MSVLQGGKFGHGFASAGITKLATPGILSFDNIAAEAVASGIVGGTISEATGGKFANGAITGALLYTVNACSSDPDRCNPFKVIAREFPKWWTSSETKDLKVGIEVTANIASIPYKVVAVVLDIDTGISVATNLMDGSYGQAALDSASVVAGKGTIKLLTDLTKSSGMLKSAAGLGVEKSSQYVLQKDCMNCEDK